jgi:hypothetical protein
MDYAEMPSTLFLIQADAQPHPSPGDLVGPNFHILGLAVTFSVSNFLLPNGSDITPWH